MIAETDFMTPTSLFLIGFIPFLIFKFARGDWNSRMKKFGVIRKALLIVGISIVFLLSIGWVEFAVRVVNNMDDSFPIVTIRILCYSVSLLVMAICFVLSLTRRQRMRK